MGRASCRPQLASRPAAVTTARPTITGKRCKPGREAHWHQGPTAADAVRGVVRAHRRYLDDRRAAARQWAMAKPRGVRQARRQASLIGVNWYSPAAGNTAPVISCGFAASQGRAEPPRAPRRRPTPALRQ
jgi:hypothetical protein